MYEKKIAELIEQIEGERARASSAEEHLTCLKNLSSDNQLLLQVGTGKILPSLYFCGLISHDFLDVLQLCM